ncbi:MAG: glycosyltransferase family 2 protein [Niastella sp.]|nr:glycosyltransferase family 2 protein [Niastella sp.]
MQNIGTKNLVSVIIPTYNRAALLKEAVESVIAQTYRPIECIVVDDGSTDNTKEVVNDLIKHNTDLFALKYIHQQNAGSQVARNTGTAAASGEFIQYLDSDDLLYPGKLEAQVHYFNQHPGCDAVFGDWEKGTTTKNEKIMGYKNDNLVEQLLSEKCIANFAMLMRRILVKKIGDWDINIKRNQEIDFHLRGVLAGGQFGYASLNCGLWRVHDNERIANKANLFQAIRFYQKWEKLLLEKQLFTGNIQQGIVKNYLWFLGEYPGSSNKELAALLKEVYRLKPSFEIFHSANFSFIKKIAGFNMAVRIWIFRYKQMLTKSDKKLN